MKRNVAILVFPEVEVLDFSGPFAVFAAADRVGGGDCFQVFTVAESPGSVRADHGLKIVPDHTMESCPRIDVLVVPGGAGTRLLLQKPALLEWIRVKARRQTELVMGVCAGALVLARAGLLDGLRVTTHATSLCALRELAPTAVIEPDTKFIGDNAIFTASGASAGIDCALHAVARLLGEEVAAATARYLGNGSYGGSLPVE